MAGKRQRAVRPHRHPDEPMAHLKAVVKYPRASLCANCAMFMLFPVILALLNANGVSVLEVTTAVPLYMRDLPARVGSDALLEGQQIATLEALSTETFPRQNQVWSLGVMFVTEGGRDIFETTESGDAPLLAAIQRVEEVILSHPDYTKWCALDYETTGGAKCARPLTPLDFFDPEYFVPTHTQYQAPPLCGLNHTSIPSFCDATISSPATWNTAQTALLGQSKLTQGAAAAINATNRDLTKANVESTASYWANYENNPFTYLETSSNGVATQTTFGNIFRRVVNAGFGSDGTAKATALRAEFYFGAPIDGETATDGDSLRSQGEKLGAYLRDAYMDLLTEEAKDMEGSLNIYWDNPELTAAFLQTNLVSDGSLVVGSVVFVWIYICFMTRSLFLGSFGVASIFLSFGPSILIYRFLFNVGYFGTLNLLAVFIILGIGADDLFVIMQAFDLQTAAAPSSPIDLRMTKALEHAGKAMLTTSLSTIVAFLANAASTFPAVWTFGLWCATVVAVNYGSVCLFFPTVMIVHEKLLKGKACCNLSCTATKESSADGVKTIELAPARGVGDEVAEVQSKSLDTEEQGHHLEAGIEEHGHAGSAADAWFAEVLYEKFIHRYNKPLVGLFSAIVIVFAVFASQITADPDPPQLMPSGHPLVEYKGQIASRFSGGSNPFRVTAQIVFGIKGLDRTGTDPTDEDDRGAVIWDEDFFDPEQTDTLEESQTWLLSFCNAARSDRTAEARWVGDPDELLAEPVKCWIESFAAYADRVGIGFPVSGDDVFDDVILAWLSSELHPTDRFYAAGRRVYDVYKPMMYGEGGAESRRFRFMIIDVALSLDTGDGVETGIAVYNTWHSWLQDQMLQAPVGLQSGFVTDVARFHFFFLQDAIVGEAIFGILLSLLFAFIILVFATQNIVMSVFAITTISCLVCGVIAFTVMNGWKLGVLESVIFVMVVGMSVDFTVHLSDAYLEAPVSSREKRVKTMLHHMGSSILSGAVSTLGSSTFLMFAFIMFFGRFGLIMFWIIGTSLVFSLLGHAAMLDLFGPEGDFGQISFSIAHCCARVGETATRWYDDERYEQIQQLSDQVSELQNTIDMLTDRTVNEQGVRVERDIAITNAKAGSGLDLEAEPEPEAK